ncbi:MAG: hypothetical protein AAF611_06135 [Bacteroidota bacterium]
MKKNTFIVTLSVISCVTPFIFYFLPPFQEFDLSSSGYLNNFNDFIFQKNYSFAAISITEVIILVLALFVTDYFIRDDIKKRELNEKCIKNINRLRNYLGYIFITWIILYSWLFLNWKFDILTQSKFSKSIVWSLADLLNVLNALFFCFASYFLINPTRYKSELEPLSKKTLLYERKFKFWRSFLILISVTFISISVMERFNIILINGNGVLFLSFWCAMCMLYFTYALSKIGFESDYYVLGPLKFYALLQVMWPILDMKSENYLSEATILVIAFLLKIYFLWLLFTSFRKGKFFKYFR